jgi:hypothetical protein
MSSICFIDTETTGLDPVRHGIWEVALITPDSCEHVWQFPVDEMAADPIALNIGRYWERRWPDDCEVTALDAIYDAHKPTSRRKNFPGQGRAITPTTTWCRHFRDLTAGLHLAGAVVSFDEERLRRLLRRNGVLHRWHYHLIDVEALAAGYLSGLATASRELGDPKADGPTDEEIRLIQPPWKSDGLSAALGVDPEDFERHTALGDAKWARAIWDAVTGMSAGTPRRAA